MKIENKINKFLNENKNKIAVNITNVEEGMELLKICSKLYKIPMDSSRMLSNMHIKNAISSYGKDAVVYVQGTNDDNMKFGTLHYAMSNGYNIMTFKQFKDKYVVKSKYIRQLKFESLNEVREPGQSDFSSEGINKFVVVVRNEQEYNHTVKWATRNERGFTGGGGGIPPCVLTIDFKIKNYMHHGSISYNSTAEAQKLWGSLYPYDDFMDMMEEDSRVKIKPSEIKV